MTSDDSAWADLEGRTLGDFLLREQIGRGGQGVVHRATQLALGREAAVKILPLERIGDGPRLRFLREVKIAAQLDHPYAAHIYAFGAEPDLLWVAMELVHGTPLCGPIPLRRFLPLLERLCEVVHSAHLQGIIHRDIKPANVMVLSRAGRLLPKLLDLGIAKELGDRTSEVLTPDPEVEPVLSTHHHASPNDETRTLSPPTPALSLPSTQAHIIDWSNVSLHPTSTPVITHLGSIVGSPPYMPPEAWRSGARVDERADVYALGVVTYECLKGRRPFEANSMSRLKHLHLEAAVPSLGPEFSPALDHVIGRALAKRPEDRYATPIELASALRAAAAQSGHGLPRIEEALRDAWLTHAPQPLAETLAVLDAARTEVQVWDALGLWKRAALHYLGVLSIAMATQSERAARDERLRAALRPLTRASLSDEEWVELIRAACALFAGAPQHSGVPELVALACPSDARDDTLAGLLHVDDPARRADDESTNLPSAVDVLGHALEKLSFLATYPLGLRRGARIEALTGLRRSSRTSLSVADLDRAGEEDVVLVDSDRKLRLRLSPLVVVGQAAHGLPEEIFLLDGPGARGMKQLAFPSLFEHQDEEARVWLDANLSLSSSAEAAAQDAGPPYLGLATFGTSDANTFFGREREIEGFLNRLRIQSLLTVVGPSGAGKSSFLQAGILPALAREQPAITVRPGRSPLAALAARLEREGVSGLSVEGMKGDRGLLAMRVHRHAEALGQPLVLIVDQLEELFTLCLDVEERETYAESLVRLSATDGPPTRVLFTLRDDFLVRAEELPAFRSQLSSGLQLLTTPQRRDLLRILVEPLRARRYAFEDDALAAEMVDAVQAQPGALALLSFTARQLWEARDKHFNRLTRRAYTALGGVGGALAQHAEATLAALDAHEQALVRGAFSHLVTSQGTRATLTRAELQQLLGNDAAGASMLEKLVAARLLVTQEGEGGMDRVEIIHEALLSAWPRLVRWQREDAEGARLRDNLRAAARQWEERHRDPGLLWRGDVLDEYRVWRARYPGTVTSSEQAFGTASLNDARRGRRLRRAALVGAMAALSLFAAFLFRANTISRKARATAEALLRDSYFDQGRQFLLRGDPQQALVYLGEAQRRGTSGAAFDFLVTEASLPLRAQQRIFSPVGGDMVLDVAIAPDRLHVLAGAVSRATLWETATGKQSWSRFSKAFVNLTAFLDDPNEVLLAIEGPERWRWTTNELVFHGPNLGFAAFSGLRPSVHRVVTGDYSGATAVWDYANDRVAGRFKNPAGAEMTALSGDGRRATALHFSDAGVLWDVEHERKVIALPTGVTRASFEPTGSRVAVLAAGSLYVYADDGRELARAPLAHRSGASGLAWNADASLIASGGDDGTVRLWKSENLEPVAELSGHTGEVDTLRFIDALNLLMTGSGDGTIRFWDLGGGGQVGELVGHVGLVSTVALSQDTSLLVSGSWDGSVRLWRWRDAVRSRPLPATAVNDHDKEIGKFNKRVDLPPTPSVGALTAKGDYLATFDEHRGAWLTPVDGGRSCRLGDGKTETREVTFSPDGAHAYSVERGVKTIGVWRTRDCVLERRLEGHDGVVRFARPSDDGTKILSGASDGTARLWNAHSGATERVFDPKCASVITGIFSHDQERVFLTCNARYRDEKLRPGEAHATAWSTRDGRLLWNIPNDDAPSLLSYFAPSPDDARVLFADWDGHIRLYDAATGRVLHEAKMDNQIDALVVTPDGKHVIVAKNMENASVLRFEDLRAESTLEANSASSVAFSKDGKLVFLAGNDTLYVFALDSRRLLAKQPHVSTVLGSNDAERVVTLPLRGAPRVWRYASDPASVRGLEELVRCRVPFKMENGQVTPKSLPKDCR